MSDWKERMERIKAANEGTYKKARQPRNPRVSPKSHPSRTHARLHRKEGKKQVLTQSLLCDMCGKKVSRRAIHQIGTTMRLCSTCKQAKR